MTGTTYRQLDYWVRRGLLEPAVAANGSGTKRRWTTEDLGRVRRLRLASHLHGGSLLDALDALDGIEEQLRAIGEDLVLT
jgi:DNA-binding transcriptional MerR regulator